MNHFGKWAALRLTFCRVFAVSTMAGLVACHNGSGNVDGPAVIGTTPDHNATAVAVGSTVSASFDRTMDATTLNDSTLTVAGPVGAVTGTVNVTGTTATFTPASGKLAYGADYVVTLSDAVRAANGRALRGGYAWSFSTVDPITAVKQVCADEINWYCRVPDDQLHQCLSNADYRFFPQPCQDHLAEIPYLVGTTPQGTANPSTVVRAHFSEAMAASTINSTTFTLTGPGGAVAGAVSYSGTTATFTPASVLTDGATYTATVTTGARDTDGNQLAAGSSWNFTATTALFKDAYGDPCNNSITTPVPGCTFNVNGGTRVTVSQDAHYNRYGNGTNDMMYVIFDGSGTGSVYNNLGVFQYNASVSGFAGYIGGTTIGVGTTGAFWESVADRTYWFGSNGVLYSANSGNANYGQAIN